MDLPAPQPPTQCVSPPVGGPVYTKNNLSPHSRLTTPETLRTPIKIYPPPPSTRALCPTPLTTLTTTQLSTLDPSGARTRLFSPTNPEAAHVGDILLVRLRSGDPYAGTCLTIRRAGVDTAVLLRNTLTRVGVEMWYKIYSPAVEGIEVVQRRARRARRAKLYYMRQPKHDPGSVQNIVTMYIRQRQVLRSGGGGGAGGDRRGAGAGGGKKGKKGKK